jgi:hypothetical protein
MHEDRKPRGIPPTQEVKKSIEIIRQEMTKIFGLMTYIESYEKARSSLDLLGFTSENHSNEIFFISEKGSRAIWKIENSDGKLICWAVAPTGGIHGWSFGFKTKEEAIRVYNSRRLN